MDVTKLIIETIKNTLGEHGLETRRIILFGSRARGTEREDSDWDLMVLIDRDITFQEKKLLTTWLKRILARKKIPNDIIIKSVNNYEKLKNSPGHIAYHAEREGLALL